VKLVHIVVAIALVSTLAGCSGKMVNVAPAPPSTYVETGPAKGTACASMPWSISNANNRAELAYRKALESSGATSLTDTKVSERWAHRVFALTLCTTIEGVGLKPVK
jgi:outer membrane lipopolysaccharide assembly protein LptE/RlpB